MAEEEGGGGGGMIMGVIGRGSKQRQGLVPAHLRSVPL
jgi:hypothetical protein